MDYDPSICLVMRFSPAPPPTVARRGRPAGPPATGQRKLKTSVGRHFLNRNTRPGNRRDDGSQLLPPSVLRHLPRGLRVRRRGYQAPRTLAA